MNQLERRIQVLRTSVTDYENNLRNFAAGVTTPGIGEVKANELLLVRRRAELQLVERQLATQAEFA